MAFIFCGLVAALNQNEATVHTFFSPQNLTPGQAVTVNVAFTSNSSDALQVTRVGLNFDWMSADSFVGVDLTNQPITVAAGATTMFPQMIISIPTNVTLGIHNYYVGVDGTQGASSTSFSWSSAQASVAVVGSNGQTGGPTVTTQPTNGGGNPSGQPDLQLYGAVAAVIIIVVLLAVVIVLRQKRAKTQTEPAQTEAPKDTHAPEQKPEEKPSSSEDFDI
jgi:hypothetical protein